MAAEPGTRVCGRCSLCCTVLRVDELAKLGGVPCRALRSAEAGGGCGIHARRPDVCRAYRCLWLQGGLDEDDRPDRLGAVLDVVTAGASTRLEIHEAEPGAFERCARLREIAERHRTAMPVRILDVGDVLDADRPYRVLLPGGVEQLVRGERVSELRDGRVVAERRLPWLERTLRRATIAWRRRRFRRYDGADPQGRR
jgi:Fe-S-cluster containining protein